VFGEVDPGFDYSVSILEGEVSRVCRWCWWWMAIIPLYMLIPAVYWAHFMLSLQAWGLECVQNVMCVVYVSVCVHMTNT